MSEKTKKTILYVIVCLATILVLYVAIRINEKRLIELSSNSDITNYLTEINYEEISNHITENPNEVIYVSNSSDNSSLQFEEILIPVIKKYNLENNMIFININNKNIADPFYQNSPQLIFYKSNEVSDVVDCSTLNNEDEVINMLKERGYIND